MGDHIEGLPSCFVCFQAHFQVHCPARLLACPPARSRADCRRQNLGSFHQMVCLNLSIQLWTCLLAYCDRGTDILLGISASLVLKPCTLVAQLMCVGICTLPSHLGRKLIISSFTRNHSYSKCNPFFFHKSQPLAITGFTAQTWDAKYCLHACTQDCNGCQEKGTHTLAIAGMKASCGAGRSGFMAGGGGGGGGVLKVACWPWLAGG